MSIGYQKEIDVNVQSQTSPLFQYLLMEELQSDIELTSPIVVDDEVINVSAGHGFTAAAGEVMVGRIGDQFFQLRVRSVATNAITVEAPADNAYPTEGTEIVRGNVNMNIDGSGTSRDFKFSFLVDTAASIPIDIQKVIFSFQHSQSGDDGKFGGISALIYGLLFRKVNGDNVGFGNYTSNQEFRDVGGDIEYTSKGSGGTEATNITIDILNSFGQVVRLNPRDGDYLLGRVRDALQTLTKFTMSIVGSFTEGE